MKDYKIRLPRKLKKLFKKKAIEYNQRVFKVSDNWATEHKWMTFEEVKETYGNILTEEELKRLE